MAKEKEVCLICKEEFTNLAVHVRTKHDLTMDEYREYDPNGNLENTVMLDSASEVEDTLGKLEKPEETVASLLLTYKISRQELTDIIEHYKNGTPLSTVQVIKQKVEVSAVEAKRLSEQDTVSTRNLYIAEALVKHYKFKVREVTTKGGSIPKTWILTKI